MAELRSNEVLAKLPIPSRALCLLNKVCPQESISNQYTITHHIKSYISYDGATSSYYHAYNGYVYINDVQIDSLQKCTFQGPSWEFTGRIDKKYNCINLSGKGPTTIKEADSIEGYVELEYTATKFKEYVISCHLPELHGYVCYLVKCICGDFTLTNYDIVLENLSIISLTTEDKTYSINLKWDYKNQTISFQEDSKYDQSSQNYTTINNKYFKTHPISLYLYTIPAYYM